MIENSRKLGIAGGILALGIGLYMIFFLSNTAEYSWKLMHDFLILAGIVFLFFGGLGLLGGFLALYKPNAARIILIISGLMLTWTFTFFQGGGFLTFLIGLSAVLLLAAGYLAHRFYQNSPPPPVKDPAPKKVKTSPYKPSSFAPQIPPSLDEQISPYDPVSR